MSRLLLLLAGVFAITNLFAQSSPGMNYRQQKASVKGQLLGYSPEVYPTLSVEYSIVVAGPEYQTKKEVWPNEDGSFSFELDHGFDYQQVWLSVGDLYFCQLLFNSELNIEIDLKGIERDSSESFSIDHVVFAGKDGPLSEYVNQFITYRNSREDWPGDAIIPVMMNREMSAEDKLDSMRIIDQRMAAIQKEFIEAYPFKESWVLANERLSDFYGNVCVTYWYKKMPDTLLEEILAHRPRMMANNAMSFYNYLGNYLQFLSSKERLALYKKVLPQYLHLEEEKVRFHDFLVNFEKFVNQETYDKEAYRMEFKYFSQQYKDELYQAELERFKAALLEHNVTDEQRDLIILRSSGDDVWKIPRYADTMGPILRHDWAKMIGETGWKKALDVIATAQAKLAKIKIEEQPAELGIPQGTLPDGTTFYLAEQDSLNDLLSALRATFPNKAIILDLWATWCGPCLFDMQHKDTRPNKQKLKEMDVEVIYLCTSSGSDADTWKKKVAELNLGGLHIFLSDQLSKEIMADFNLRGYPSHIFLNRSGQLVPDVLHGIRNVDFDKVKESMD